MAQPFTPSDSALVLIDHQFGTMQLIKTLPLEQVTRNTLALARAAQILHIPAVLTSSQEDQLQGAMLPELEPFLPNAFASRVRRLGVVNAWDDPAFAAAVEGLGRRNLIMAGVTTDVCLVYPAITAVERGYQVQAVMDASGSPFELSEEMARQRMRDAGVVLTATNTMIAELAHDWSRPGGMDLLELLFTKVLPPIQPAAARA
ncbi:MAG TPA: isochorismatase family protein [Albitalea sp.]|uniref:isochorismatase family protein n=1 Tax=Piscinibacter sp. TaxID=1903157 RepID=UPI002ED126D3